jgi:hypothetical protein
VECFFQALDELDDWVAIVRQRWLAHGGERPVTDARPPPRPRAQTVSFTAT